MKVNNELTVKKIGYKDVLKQKEYMKAILANIINRFGDSIDSIAFTWMVYKVTNSAAWSSIIFGVNFLPSILLQPFAGALVENRNKKRIMIITDIVRGLCVCSVAVMYIVHWINPWYLLFSTIMISTAEAFRNPSSTAILPNILEKEYYEFGMSLNATLCRIMELIGLAASGSIIALFGLHTAILIDTVTFFCSAFIFLFIDTKEEKSMEFKIRKEEYWNTLKDGIQYIKHKPVILNFISMAMITNGILVPLNSLQAPLVKNILKQGEYMLSVISISMVIGMGFGSALYPYIAKRIHTSLNVFLGGILLSAYYILLILCGRFSDVKSFVYSLCFIITFLAGIGASQLIAIIQVQFVRQVETEYLARAGAIMSAGCVIANPVVSFLVSILTKCLSITSIFYMVGGLGICYFILIYLLKIRFE